MEEAGVAGFDISGWFGILVPAGTPKDIVARLNAEIAKALNPPEVRAMLAGQGVEVTVGSADQFAAFVKSEIAKYAKIIRESGAKAD
jgi:tripartite-type tricarboxylate transporter receptor subunit TctC